MQSSQGLGTIFDHPPEMRAAEQWQSGIFGPEEYELARQWRAMLRQAPEGMSGFTNGSANRFTFRDLTAVKAFAEQTIDADGKRYQTLRMSLEVVGIAKKLWPTVITRWKELGGPPLAQFAPYTRHTLVVDLFRILAMASGLINPNKTLNFADIAYLYYLPFCQIFVSNDKLHRQCAQLFLGPQQQFVWGSDLRPHLAQLATEYLNDPALSELGLIGISERKKFSADSYIGSLMVKAGVRLEKETENLAHQLSPKATKALIEHLKAAVNAPAPSAEADLSQEDMHTSFKRYIPRMRGRFPMMPPNVK